MHNSYRHNIKRARMKFLRDLITSGITSQNAHWFVNRRTASFLYNIHRPTASSGFPARP